MLYYKKLAMIALAGVFAGSAVSVLAIGAPKLLTGVSIGSPVINGTGGSVLFVDTNGAVGQDNSNLYWDDTNNFLGIGSSTPWGALSVEMGLANPAFVVADKGTTTPAFIVDGRGKVGIGTSSPTLSSTFSIATSSPAGTATTTLELGTSQQSAAGSCFQLYSATGTPVRVYVDFNATSTLRAESGACNSAAPRP